MTAFRTPLRHRTARPVAYEDLLRVAENLRWTWNTRARALFTALDPASALTSCEHPHQLLVALGRSTVEERLAADPDLAAAARAVVDDAARYQSRRSRTWFARRQGRSASLQIAYFAAEFALTDSLPMYAGGLGAVAGEQLKSASALGVPLVGVGLLYRETSHQWLDDDGFQQESWEVLDFSKLAVEEARDPLGRPVQVSVPLPGRDVRAQVWTVAVGRNRLYLLDTSLRRNDRADRRITARLYGGDEHTRIQQELVLGIGGVRALAALGLEPDLLHLNEGHTAFAALEQIRRVMARDGLTFAEARLAAAPSVLFTTHTPVAAGHDYFPGELVEAYLRPYVPLLGVDLETLTGLGRFHPADPADSFCPTVLAMRLAGARNGVSRLHGDVTRRQWAGLWPRLPATEVPIGHVTNGIHFQSWISPEFDQLLDQQLDPDWRTTPGDAASWKRLLDLDDRAVWDAKRVARARLVDVARSRRLEQLARRGRRMVDEEATPADLLDPDALTIGFVGRFVAYKRPTLFLRDPERLERLLSDEARPVQILFGGRAHPRDEGGKRLLREVSEFARARHLEHRIFFVEDFDLTMDRALSQGADLWLNTPRRPLEACGIGGMKAGANGALNLSTIDGWWDEAWNDADPSAAPIGWCIGSTEEYEDLDEQDEVDAASLYDVLEREIVPCFYERDRDDVPRRWLRSVRQSIATLASTWHSHRMVQQYVESFYLPGVERARWLEVGGGVRARDLRGGLDRLREGWPAIEISAPTVAPSPSGDLQAEILVELGSLTPADVTVQLWVATEKGEEVPEPARFVSSLGGVARYLAPVRSVAGVPVAVVGRVLPNHPLLDDPRVPGLIAWSEPAAP